VWRGGLGREQSRRKGGGAFSKCKSRGGKPPTVSGYSAQSLWSRVGHGRARGRSPPRRPPHPPPPPLGPLGARVAAASSRAGIAPAVAREGNRPFRGARAFLRVRRPRAPLPMVAPRARAHPRPCGPIEYVTLLVPRGEQDAPPQPHALPMPVNLPMPLPMPMPPVVPRPPLQSCINLQSRVACPHNPSTCLASHLYPTPVADKPQASDQKDGERARAPSNRRPVPRARRRAPVSH